MGIFLVLGLLHACYTPGITALCTVMMDKAVGTSPGTNYSLQYGLFALVSFVSGGLSTVLASAIGYENVVVLATCAALAAAVLTPMLYPGSAPTPVNTTLSELEMPNQ